MAGFEGDGFYVEQLLRPLVNLYRISTLAPRRAAGALARRLVDYVPYVGDFIPIPYNFEFLVGTERVGTFNRIFGFRDRYVLDLSADAQRRIDRRLAVALAIALDAIQNR